jgi:hypothetical protein
MIAQLLTSSVISLTLVKYYSSETNAFYLLAGVWLSYFLVTLSIGVLITDIYQLNVIENGAQDLTVWWRSVYWSQFILTFVILPFLI